MPRDSNPSFMNGVPELLVLHLLGQKEMYGYEIVQVIQEQTNSIVATGEGVVYPLLHRLESEGLLASRRKAVNGRSRIYYSVTQRGSKKLVTLAATWANLSSTLSRVLQGGQPS